MASQPILGCVFIFCGNFAPRGYMLCQGQILPISQYTALFSLLGTTYGGNGVTTFALPDLRGRAPVGSGAGPGLSPVNEGQIGGVQTTSILSSNLPSHTHTLNASTTNATQPLPTGNILASIQDSNPAQALGYINAAPNAVMAGTSIGLTGSNLPLNTQSPYLGINYIIATQGIFPSRN
jgi:microcystin-dependent protein